MHNSKRELPGQVEVPEVTPPGPEKPEMVPPELIPVKEPNPGEKTPEIPVPVRKDTV